jgi:D-lactate dehydrogenase
MAASVMKIVVFEAEPWTRAAWSKIAHDFEVKFVEEFLTQTNVLEHTNADMISMDMSVLDAEILTKFAGLKLIAARSTGVDQIDLEYCRLKGITVCNVPEYAENAVSEHVFAMILSLSHHIVEVVNRTRKKNFSWESIQAFELRGKTLGVIGTGAIGRRVSKIAKGFDMDVVAFDVMPDEKWAVENAVRYLSLEETLKLAEIITLHVPATPETHHLLSDDQFNLMKDGVVLINTARGDVIDIQALLRALSCGKVAAAGLDVLPEEHAIREEKEQLATLFGQKNNLETLLASHILLQHPNVIVTPHCAFFSKEAVERLLEVTIANIEAFIRGEPQNVIVSHLDTDH